MSANKHVLPINAPIVRRFPFLPDFRPFRTNKVLFFGKSIVTKKQKFSFQYRKIHCKPFLRIFQMSVCDLKNNPRSFLWLESHSLVYFVVLQTTVFVNMLGTRIFHAFGWVVRRSFGTSKWNKCSRRRRGVRPTKVVNFVCLAHMYFVSLFSIIRGMSLHLRLGSWLFRIYCFLIFSVLFTAFLV